MRTLFKVFYYKSLVNFFKRQLDDGNYFRYQCVFVFFKLLTLPTPVFSCSAHSQNSSYIAALNKHWTGIK